jgi:hypothetical protein
MRFTTQDLAMMRTRQAPRDVAILASLVLPPEISLSVRTDDAPIGAWTPKVDASNDAPTQDDAATRPRTFTDRIASSPQLVEATITRAIKLKAYRQRQAARPPVMAVRMAGSK